MFKRGLLLVLCATVLSGCVIHPAHLRFTPPRVDLVDGHGGHHNGGYNNDYNHSGGHRRHHGHH